MRNNIYYLIIKNKMSSRFVDWNKINDEDSSEQEHDSDSQPYQFKGSEKQPKTQIKQQKTVSRKDLQQPVSPRLTKFNSKKKVSEIIQQQLVKIQSDKKDKIWLFVPYDQTEKNQQISAVLNKLEQIEHIRTIKQGKGWNILLKKQDARTFVREGLKQQRGWCKFIYSTMNQPRQDYYKQDYYKNSQPGYSNGTGKKKFVEKSQKNIRQFIEDGNKKQQKISKEQNSQQVTSQSTQSKKLQSFKQEQSKLFQRANLRQKSEYQQKRNNDDGKKKKYVAKQSSPIEQATFTIKKTVSLSNNIPEKKEENQPSQLKPQPIQKKQQNKSEQEDVGKEIQSPKKKKNKNKNKEKIINKQGISSNNPFNSLKTY